MKGVIFDLDGTLTLTQHLHEQAYAAVFKKFGITYTRGEDFYEAGIGGDHTFRIIFEKHGVKDFNLEECKAEKRRIYGELLKNATIEPVPGVKEFVEKLRAKNIPYIVATGNREEFARYTLEKAGLDQYFSLLITNRDVKSGKPAPDIFLAAAEKLGLAPADCIVFEDAWSGVTAAKKANMFCVALETLAPKEFLIKTGANLVIKDYFDPQLEKLFQ